MKSDSVVVAVIIAFGVFFAGVLLGGLTRDRQVKADAIKAGVAEWVADERGNAEFRWRDCGEDDG